MPTCLEGRLLPHEGRAAGEDVAAVSGWQHIGTHRFISLFFMAIFFTAAWYVPGVRRWFSGSAAGDGILHDFFERSRL